MSGYSYLLGFISGLAILIIPTLVLGAFPTEAAARWLSSLRDPEPGWFDLSGPEPTRPAVGFQPGDPTPTPPMPPATLQPATPPGATPIPAPPRDATPDATPAEGATRTPTPTPDPDDAERVQVANTQGRGVVFRASPQMEDRTTQGMLEGAQATILEREGDDWVRVRADNGQEGWVPTRYLEPVD